MSHILIGLALCAALFIYPGGVTIAAPAALMAWPKLWSRGGFASWRRQWRTTPIATVMGAWGLAGLAVLSLPWPGNPALGMSFAGLTQAGVGGVALTVLGLTGLEGWAGGDSPRRGVRFGFSALGALSVVLLAELLRAQGWQQILAAGGPGPELGRLAVGALLLVSAPWAGGTDPEVDPRTAAAWAARLAIALFVCFPQLRFLPVAVSLGALWAGCLVVGAAWAGGGRRRLHQLPLLTEGQGAARL
ncbi:MAG TPA: hypothetical protein VNF75_09385 [Candidatus Dormibacteraeota bacterium]|nr:hypothetical protein [Candidatus Dormibacteraeota bacterium]